MNEEATVKIKILSLIVGLAAILLIFSFLNKSLNKSGPENSMANLISQAEKEMVYQFTDDNSNESAIIRTDSASYTGVSEIVSYFSVQNTSATQNFDIQFYFPKELKAGVTKIERRSANTWERMELSNEATQRPEMYKESKPIPDEFRVTDKFDANIGENETQHFRATIAFEEGTEGEFWIEAIGDKGSYGLLDPTFASVTIRGGLGGNSKVKIRGGSSGAAAETPSFIQSNGNSQSDTSPLSTTISATTAGNLIVVCAAVSNGLVTSVTDDKSNTYTRAARISTGALGTDIWYAYNTTGGVTSVSINYPNWQSVNMIVAEYSGITTGSDPLDKTATYDNGYNGGSSWTSGNTVATTQAGELLIGCARERYVATTFAAGTDYNGRRTEASYLFLEDRNVSSTGAYAATGTRSGASGYQIDALISTFKATIGGTAGNVKFR